MPKETDEQRMLRQAYHEAARGVAAVELDCPFERIGITLGREGWPTRMERPEEDETAAVVSLAGIWGDVLYLHDHLPEGDVTLEYTPEDSDLVAAREAVGDRWREYLGQAREVILSNVEEVREVAGTLRENLSAAELVVRHIIGQVKDASGEREAVTPTSEIYVSDEGGVRVVMPPGNA